MYDCFCPVFHTLPVIKHLKAKLLYYQMGDPEAKSYQVGVRSLFCVTLELKLRNHCVITFKMENMNSFVVSSVWAAPSANTV